MFHPITIQTALGTRASLLPFSLYNSATETWGSYLTWFECYLKVNKFTNVTDNRKQALFLSLCGSKAFKMGWALVTPLAVQVVLWEMFQNKLKAHYAPKPSKITSHHAFHHKNQAAGKLIITYITGLCKATIYCEFRDR